MEELLIDGQVYIPTKRAATLTGYAKDYIGQLCREGRIEAKLVGRSWYVLETSIREHRFGTEAHTGVGVAPKAEEVGVQKVPEVAAAAPIEAMDTWERPSYTSEPLEEIMPMPLVRNETEAHPTSLTNTAPEEHSFSEHEPVSQVQDAWKEWFSEVRPVVRPVESVSYIPEAVPATVEEPVTELVEEEKAFTEPYEAPREPEVINTVEEETTEAPVRLTKNVYGSMDIGYARRPEPEALGRVIEERRVAPRTRRTHARAKQQNHIVLKAVLVGVMLLIASVTVIGTGALQVFSPTWLSSTPVIDFLAGVKMIDR